MRKRDRRARRRGGIPALVYAQNGHGLGQSYRPVLMLARVVQGLSVPPQLLPTSAQLFGTEGGACSQGVIYLLHVHGAVEGEALPQRAGRPTTA